MERVLGLVNISSMKAAQILDSIIENKEIDSAHNAYFKALWDKEARTPENLALIASSTRWAYQYTRNVIQDRWPEAAPVIMSVPYHAYEYALNVIGGRWPEAEAIIATDAESAYLYARYVINCRFPEGETAMHENQEYWDEYTEWLLDLDF